MTESSWKDLVAPVGTTVTLAAAAVWRFFVGRRKRQDDREDSELATLRSELATVRRERDDAITREREMQARWIREVKLGASRACDPPPPRTPLTLPPPPFKEPEPIRRIREEAESKTLRRLRRGEPDPDLDQTLTNFMVDTSAAPRAKQPSFAVVEVDATDHEKNERR